MNDAMSDRADGDVDIVRNPIIDDVLSLMGTADFSFAVTLVKQDIIMLRLYDKTRTRADSIELAAEQQFRSVIGNSVELELDA